MAQELAPFRIQEFRGGDKNDENGGHFGQDELGGVLFLI
jgi:hypothetical protein